MRRPIPRDKRLLLVAAAGAATTVASALFITGTIAVDNLRYPVSATALLGAVAGVCSVLLAAAPSRRSSLPFIVAFALGMTVTTLGVSLYVHTASLAIEDPRHGVVWPQFAILFASAMLVGVAAFSAATSVTSRVAAHRESQAGRRQPDA